MIIVPIRDLEPYQPQSGKKIRVRVCRKWRQKNHKDANQFFGLNCVFVDAMGDAIEGFVRELDYDFVNPKIEEGCLYDITHFHVGKGKSSFQVVPNDAQLNFNTRTVFSKLLNVHPAIPRHRFYLQDYDSLSSRKNNDSILTDVFGHISALQPLEEIIVADGRNEKKCEIYIENLRKQEIKVTLWGDTATNFNFKALEEATNAVFVVFSSLRVKTYDKKPSLNSCTSTLSFIDPDIPELKPYKLLFGNSTNIIRKVPASTRQQRASHELQAAKKLTVNELNILDPEKYKDDVVVSRATIVRFDTHNGWWYKACPENCYKQLKTDSHIDQLRCSIHGIIDKVPIPWFKVGLVLEDITDETNAIIIGRPAEALFKISCEELVFNKGFVDQQEFPEAILQVKGQCKLFQFRFGTMKNNFGRNDLLIQKISVDKVELVESSSKQIEMPAKMLLPTSPHLLKQVSDPPLITSPDTPAKITSRSKKRARRAKSKAILSSIRLTRRKLESDYMSEEEPKTTAILKEDAEDDAEDSDNMPIISYRKKEISTDLETTSTAITEYAFFYLQFICFALL